MKNNSTNGQNNHKQYRGLCKTLPNNAETNIMNPEIKSRMQESKNPHVLELQGGSNDRSNHKNVCGNRSV